jgi:diguanylate cyclase (GGDEF)-like protein
MRPVPDPVTPDPGPKTAPIALAEDKLARLGVELETMRAVLVRLLQDVVRAESRLDHSQAEKLVEANEQLVLTALAGQAEAETMARTLERAHQAATLDSLTQLPNRTTLIDRLRLAMAHAKRHGSRLALLFLDIDDFKSLNDTRGHGFGDKALCLVADRMRSVVRAVDTVSRHGGDEFVVLLDELDQPGDARVVADKLMAAISAPAELEGRTVVLTASIGIALYPDDGEAVETLIAHADAAMYESKRQRVGSARRPAAAPVAPASLQTQAAHGADAERRYALLREANEKLVLAALSAQELKRAAELARLRQSALIAAVADELRNPMAPIRIAAAMLGGPPADEVLLPRVQGIVEQQMTNMSRLVGELVDASNMAAGGLTLEQRRVDMAQVIDAAIAGHQPMTAERGQHFGLQRPSGAFNVLGDPFRLELIVSNLLDNASKHTHDGGRINLSVDVSAETLTMTVSDNGIGITPQMLAQVFDPFVQDTQAIGFTGVGLGIGLTVSLALAQAHGGTLTAYSAGPSLGSRFVLTLPLAARDPAPEAQPQAGPAAAEPGPLR